MCAETLIEQTAREILESARSGDAPGVIVYLQNLVAAKDRRIAELERDLGEAVETLGWLYDLQNGCPLPKYEADWNKTMDKANDVILKHEAQKQGGRGDE